MCSGAMLLAIAQASIRLSHLDQRAAIARATPRSPGRAAISGNSRVIAACDRYRSGLRSTALAGLACAISSCSACENKSIATQSGFTMARVVGNDQDFRRAGNHVDADDAGIRGAWPRRRRHCRGRRSCRPAGSSACRRRARRSPAPPPIVKSTRSTPATWAAARTSGLRSPPGVGNDHDQLAHAGDFFAGTAFISTDDG